MKQIDKLNQLINKDEIKGNKMNWWNEIDIMNYYYHI